MGAKEIQFLPQQIIFEEGDQSTHLYYVKSGVIRIFKRKKDGNIEIDTVRAGQMLGELSFLDELPRSASAEALTTCEMIEISKSTLDDALAKLPEWFVAMTRTITSRMRNATNKIRHIDAISNQYETDQYGNRSKEYTYINTSELLRFSTALLAVASRYGKGTHDEIQFSAETLERFASQILQVGAAKVISLIELFKETGLLKEGLILTNISFLDQFIRFVNEQNIVETHKKRTLSALGFQVLKAVATHAHLAKPHQENRVRLNVAPAITEVGIQISALQELFDQGFVHTILINSATDIVMEFEPKRLAFEFQAFWILVAIEKLNESKRKA